MRGKKTSPEIVEEIKALSLIYSSQTISAKTGVALRTVYEILSRKDNPVIEAKREENRLKIVDKVWDDKAGEILKLKTKMEMILQGLNQEKVTKARLTELSTSYGILFDKRQLLTGGPTANINSLTALITSIHEKRQDKEVIVDEEEIVIDEPVQGRE